MSTRILALHRDQDVVCASCGRTVTRKSRQQRYCSIRCKEKRRGRVRKAFLGGRYQSAREPP